MSLIVSQITGVSGVYSTVCSGANKKKHQSSASLVFVTGIQRWPLDSHHKGQVTWKMFPFDNVIMCFRRDHQLIWCVRKLLFIILLSNPINLFTYLAYNLADQLFWSIIHVQTLQKYTYRNVTDGWFPQFVSSNENIVVVLCFDMVVLWIPNGFVWSVYPLIRIASMALGQYQYCLFVSLLSHFWLILLPQRL